MNEIVIIGAGPTGLFGAFTAGLRDLKGLVLESSYTYGGQISALYGEKNIYDVPGIAKIKGNEFIAALYKQYARYEEQIPIKFNTLVTEIIKEKDYFIINTNNGTYYSKTVLITNGGGIYSPKQLNCEGLAQQTNVLYYVENIKMFKDKRVAILGGGDSALDWALELSEVASEVNLVHRRDSFRAHQGVVKLFKSKANGKTVTPYRIKNVVGDKTVNQIVLEHLKTKELMNLKTDYLLVFYGVENNKSDLSNWGINFNKHGIIVDQSMQTNVSGIYAAGSGVFYEGKLDMIATGMGEVSTAIGKIAEELYPNRNINTLYSSMLVKE